MKYVTTVEGERMSGKTEALLSLSLSLAKSGQRVLYVCLNGATARHTFARARNMDLESRPYSARGRERIVFEGAGSVWFISSNSDLQSMTGATIVLDDFDFYSHQLRVLGCLGTKANDDTRFVKTRSLDQEGLPVNPSGLSGT